MFGENTDGYVPQHRGVESAAPPVAIWLATLDSLWRPAKVAGAEPQRGRAVVRLTISGRCSATGLGRLPCFAPVGPAAHAADRYTIRPGESGRWTVWDTRRDEPVALGEGLTESAARDLARRLNDAYRRSQGDQ